MPLHGDFSVARKDALVGVGGIVRSYDQGVAGGALDELDGARHSSAPLQSPRLISMTYMALSKVKGVLSKV